MGYGSCGTDDLGRPIGYTWEGYCDYPGCYEVIDRGLGCVCGTMHGGENGCGRYFCPEHQYFNDAGGQSCPACSHKNEEEMGCCLENAYDYPKPEPASVEELLQKEVQFRTQEMMDLLEAIREANVWDAVAERFYELRK